jgi:uncharacterized radical SAM protein YgiQ
MNIPHPARPFSGRRADPDVPLKFLPATRGEMRRMGWQGLDIILVTGDAYIDSPFIGAAVIGRVLASAGWRVGIIAQPSPDGPADITRLGEPELFWGVTSGCVDSMITNRTAVKKRRMRDDFTPGGKNDRRPDRALIRYANLIRGAFDRPAPIVLGGIEASLRRIAHYDYWDDRVRKSVLVDAKADYLVYGMGERAVLELAQALKDGADPSAIRGLCTLSPQPPKDFLELPSFDEAASDKRAFLRMFRIFYDNNDPVSARGLVQKQDSRYLVQNPPAELLSAEELSRFHDLPFTREVHPLDSQRGPVKALETIRFSIASHRGCFAECSFCAIAVHQGRRVTSRTEVSILKEAKAIAALPGFKGYILDVGGPTANMFGMECPKMETAGACADKRCLEPRVCRGLRNRHARQTALLKKLRAIPGVKKVFVASGLRYDLLLADREEGGAYLDELVEHHVSGQLKVAPEHSEEHVLELMGKPGVEALLQFRDEFQRRSKAKGLKQFLTYYFIAAHPGCTMEDMRALKDFVRRELKLNPEQAQIFTPAPSTWSAAMYYTGLDRDGKPLFVEKDARRKQAQKDVLVPFQPFHHRNRKP